MSALLSFVGDLAIIGMALMGFIVSISVFLSWLDTSRPRSLRSIVDSAEAEIDRLQHDAISQMFDTARRARMERTIGDQQ